MCSADPEFTQHSSIPKSEAPVLIDLTTKSAKKLVVVPPATVELGLCSAAIHDVSYDSLFTALELIALKPWLVLSPCLLKRMSYKEKENERRKVYDELTILEAATVQ